MTDTTTYETFNLLEVRGQLGLSRNDMAKMLGWTVSRVWAIEKRGDTMTPQEYAHASGVLADRLGSHEEMEAETLQSRDRVLRDTPEGAVRLVDWEGISHGDRVKIKGEPGIWVFQYHHTGPTGAQYVTVYGGPKGHASMRSFRPERVRLSSKR